MAGRGFFSFLSLILVSAGQMFGLFILLGGAIDHRPISNFYFLQADTTNIPNAPQLARWTFWNICEGASGHNVCSGSGYGSISPARPLDPPSSSNFDTTENVPAQFVGTNFYYLMTRCMFAFTLIALFFGGCAMLTGVLALCSRLAAKLSGFLMALAFIMQGVAAGLMTGAYVKGRDHFRSNGQNADIGTYAFGFMWAAFACFFISTVLFCMGGKGKKSSSTKGTPESPAAGTFFKGGRSTSTRSRGSFINGDNKEYV